MIKLTFYCWNCHCHEIELSEKKADTYITKLHSGRVVCGVCSSILKLTARSDQPSMPTKAFGCSNNHLNMISVFGKVGKLSIEHNDKHENLDGMIEDISKLKCLHCNTKLYACDSTILEHPNMPSFKTRMKVGDLWDKYRTPAPIMGSYDEETPDPDNPFLPKYTPSEFEQRNKERLKQIKKTRNIPLDRTPGKPIDQSDS